MSNSRNVILFQKEFLDSSIANKILSTDFSPNLSNTVNSLLFNLISQKYLIIILFYTINQLFLNLNHQYSLLFY